MKHYEVTIQPLSAFGTPLKGDTLFGHFCWQAAYTASLVAGGLETALSKYPERPFAVFSSAWPRFEGTPRPYVFKRPDVPLSWLFSFETQDRESRYQNIKTHKAQKWMQVNNSLQLDFEKVSFATDVEVAKQALEIATPQTRRILPDGDGICFVQHFLQPHNSINRLTDTTGIGAFAPYAMASHSFCPETELVIFVLVDETQTSIERICDGLSAVGRFGFGRDASIGLGRFEIVDTSEPDWPSGSGYNAAYTLAPCVPKSGHQAYFTPFVRYGKHGDQMAVSQNPFKNPVIMADEGAVLMSPDQALFEKPYVGRAVAGISKIQPGAVTQGYAPYLPMRLEC